MTGEEIMKKIMLLIILGVVFTGCSFFDGELWDEVRKENEERGRVCERNEKGYWSCYDTKQEITPAYKISRRNMKLWRLGKRLSERSEFVVFPP